MKTPARPRGRPPAPSAEEIQALRDRLAEAEDTLEALRTGAVDAVVVHGAAGHQIYSLAGAEQPYRVYVERMQEGAVTLSADGLILFCNQRFAEMAGSSLEQVIGTTIAAHLPVPAWEEIARVFDHRGTVAKHATKLRAAHGDGLPVLLTASELPMPGQEVMCLVVTDLSAQEETAQLRLAKEVAERANAAKDHFLAALSHELRTPLTPVLLTATALRAEEHLPAEVRDALAMICRNIELETRLIDDLLDLTRIAHGKLELRRAPAELHALLGAALEICESDLQRKSIRLLSQLAPEPAWMDGDAVRLQQAFWNLLRNAIKFTPTGGAITLASQRLPGGIIRLEVRDSGIGFAPEASLRLFEAFAQEDREITRRFGGLGLGLAISRSIVEAHGGRISASSEGAGKGATFTIELPLLPPDAPAAAEPRDLSREPAAALRILLVEDHADTRAAMLRALRRLGHAVETADCAAAALAAAAAQPFDLVISDLGLPDQTGEELMSQLRDRHALSGIAISGYGMAEDIAHAHAAGFAHHLTKPIEWERLRDLLATLRPRAEA